ncbi:hypothetical protein BOW53_00120 [Solemya pervernicosa gill symbiont]|uniref:WGR domain-containing protein n=2 Tax=Gammaproteobacteria incertae sedis TaxID=118884 RepID=A0A1T2LB16_9GAMM|nr:WGR domain-containing protein [Candidatus Reidiella endopervernicosa]OOZ42287.1 hypothetical protein BOW53_00120 [Solemya pervernicosa gill symbiont]QKQ25684.1 WGR domain-containing protein [Candidatus Reidiella endopervernicosa]
MRIYMQTPAAESTPPRFYHLILQQDLIEGWNVIREWGNQGSSGRVKREHYDTIEQAEEALLKSRDAQIKRGFSVVFLQGQVAPK